MRGTRSTSCAPVPSGCSQGGYGAVGGIRPPDHTVNKGYDLLRQEGLLRIGRKAGAVVQRDATSGPPRPGWEEGWTGRLRTMLAEATAQGLAAEEIIGHCQDIVAGFVPVAYDGPAVGEAS